MAQTAPLIRPRWRSLLYVPATAERFVEKAHTRGADAITTPGQEQRREGPLLAELNSV